MNVVLGQTPTIDFTTSDPKTGQVSNADFLPTCQIFDGTNGTPVLTPVVAQRVGQIGDYMVTFLVSVTSGFTAGHVYNIIVSATVNGITAKANIKQFTVVQPSSKVISI